jgi:hypothetical protein
MPSGQRVMKNLSLQIAAALTAAVFAVLAALLTERMLTPRGFGIAGLVTTALCGYVWNRALKSYVSTNAGVSQPQSLTWRGRKFYLRLAPFLIVLAFAIWATRGGPWLPRLIGMIMLLLFCVGALRYRR